LDTRHSVSEDEDSTSNIGQALQTPPTIVAMCATPQFGTSLIEQCEGGNPLRGTHTGTSSASSFVPTFGERLMRHVAVLTDDGEVHLLEFLYRPTMVTGKPGQQSLVIDDPSVFSTLTRQQRTVCDCGAFSSRWVSRCYLLMHAPNSSNNANMHRLRIWCLGRISSILYVSSSTRQIIGKRRYTQPDIKRTRTRSNHITIDA
jgi:hypothetical protein